MVRSLVLTMVCGLLLFASSIAAAGDDDFTVKSSTDTVKTGTGK